MKNLFFNLFSILFIIVERCAGTIVNIGSLAGFKTFPHHAVYCATKFGVHALTEQIREEVSQYDVRLINIAPGTVDTELTNHPTNEQATINDVEKKPTVPHLTSADIARYVMFAYQQPQSICIREMVLCNTRQRQ